MDASAVITKWLARDKSEVTAADRATGDRLVRLAEMIELPSRPVRSSVQRNRPLPNKVQYLRDRIEMNRTVLDEAASLSSGTCRLYKFVRRSRSKDKKHHL